MFDFVGSWDDKYLKVPKRKNLFHSHRSFKNWSHLAFSTEWQRVRQTWGLISWELAVANPMWRPVPPRFQAHQEVQHCVRLCPSYHSNRQCKDETRVRCYSPSRRSTVTPTAVENCFFLLFHFFIFFYASSRLPLGLLHLETLFKVLEKASGFLILRIARRDLAGLSPTRIDWRPVGSLD